MLQFSAVIKKVSYSQKEGSNCPKVDIDIIQGATHKAQELVDLIDQPLKMILEPWQSNLALDKPKPPETPIKKVRRKSALKD
jgi:hypothetical protein